jgi:sec-independent protein translocase protein TatA
MFSSLGAPEIIIIAIVIFALFGYKKLPDAARSLGRSMRIIKAETKGMHEDDVRAKAEAEYRRSPLEGAVQQPATEPTPAPEAEQAPKRSPEH